MNTTPYSILQSTVNVTTYINTTSTIDGEFVQGVHDLPLGFSLLVINTCIVVFNSFTIAVIVRFRTKNAIDIFVLALATTDLIKGLIPVPMSVYIYLTEWYLTEGSMACNFFGWVAFATNSGSMLILTLMAIERFFAIVKPFTYKAWVRPKKIYIVIIFAELFTAAHSTLPLIGVGRILPYNDGAYSHFDYSRHSKGTIAYSMFIIVYGFSMILVVMVAYSFVFHKIRDLIHRHRKMSNARSDASNRYDKSLPQMNLKTETMFSYLTVALMVLFWFSWLPFLMVVMTFQVGVKKPHPNLDLFAIRIAVVNSMLNPIACALLCKPYRRGIVYYFKVFFSYCGLKKPEKNVWDPWRRRSRRHNTRRHKPSVSCEYNDYDFTRSEYANSFNDSGLGTGEYTRTRIPSVLETYDSYRAKRVPFGNHEQQDGSLLDRQSNRLLPMHHSSHQQTAHGKFPTVEEEENSVSSISSDHSSPLSSSESSDSSEEKSKRKASRKGSRLRRFGSSKKGSEKEEHITEDPTPLQRRKKMFVNKVQKYLNNKMHRKDSLDVPCDARRSVSVDDLLEKSLEAQKKNRYKRKVHSFHIRSKKNGKNEELVKEEEELDDLLIHGPRKRAVTLPNMDEDQLSFSSSNSSLNKKVEINNDLNKNTENEPPNFVDNSSDANNCDLSLESTLQNENHDGKVTIETLLPLENGTITAVVCPPTPKVPSPNQEERRCISETYSDHMVFLEDTIKTNGKIPTASEHSLKMIDSVTKELVRFSQSSLTMKPPSLDETTCM